MTSLIALARDMQREADKWAPQLASTGELDVESLARMERLRQELLLTDAETHLDRLMKLGAMRSLIGFMFLLSESDTKKEAPKNLRLIQGGLLEVLVGLNSLLPHFETNAGETLAGLGLFTDQGCLQ